MASSGAGRVVDDACAARVVVGRVTVTVVVGSVTGSGLGTPTVGMTGDPCPESFAGTLVDAATGGPDDGSDGFLPVVEVDAGVDAEVDDTDEEDLELEGSSVVVDEDGTK